MVFVTTNAHNADAGKLQQLLGWDRPENAPENDVASLTTISWGFPRPFPKSHYSFPDLPAGYSYAVGIAKTGTAFLPANRDIQWLAAARQINFITGMRVATTVSVASFRRDPIPLGGLVSVFGTDLASTTRVLDIRPSVYGSDGTEVWLEDNSGAEAPMQLLFISPNQINCYMPYFMQEGQGIVKVIRDGKIVSLDILQIAKVSPGIFSANADGKGLAAASLIFIKGEERTYGTVATCDTQGCLANPIDVNLYDGVYLEMYGTGVNNDKGAAAVTATIGGQPVSVLYAGTQCCFIGVDQINLQIPKSLASKGVVDVVITVEGKIANTVKINVK